LRISPRNFLLHHFRGCPPGQEQYQEALDTFEEAAKLYPDKTFLNCDRAYACLLLEKYGPCIDLYSAFLEKVPGDSAALCNREWPV